MQVDAPRELARLSQELRKPTSNTALTEMRRAAADVLECNDVPWKAPKDLGDGPWSTGAMKSAMLVGDSAYGAITLVPDIYSGIFWLEPGTHYPCHAHEAFETFIVLSGGTTACWTVDGIVNGEASEVIMTHLRPHRADRSVVAPEGDTQK